MLQILYLNGSLSGLEFRRNNIQIIRMQCNCIGSLQDINCDFIGAIKQLVVQIGVQVQFVSSGNNRGWQSVGNLRI